MNYASFIPLLIFILIFANNQKSIKAAAMHRAAKKKLMKKGEHIMEAIINKYLGKGVVVRTITETHSGILTAYNDGWLTLTYKGKDIEVNADYIIKIQPYAMPREKHVIE